MWHLSSIKSYLLCILFIAYLPQTLRKGASWSRSQSVLLTDASCVYLTTGKTIALTR